MSTGNISNPPSAAPAESKSARKKKAKAEAAAAAAAAAASPATPTKEAQTPGEGSVNGAEDSEHPYIKELQKYVYAQVPMPELTNASRVLTLRQ